MEKIKLTFSEDDACEIVWGTHEDFEVIQKTYDEPTRWSYTTEVVVRQKSTGNYFWSYYSSGNTEMQEHSPYEYEEPVFTQVFPVEKVVTVYE